MSWSVYILCCSDNSLYTGITTDVERRVTEHNDKSTNLGAKFTRGRQPVKLVFQELAVSRSQATKREMEIKSLTRTKKLNLIESVKK